MAKKIYNKFDEKQNFLYKHKILGVSGKRCFLPFPDETYGPISHTASQFIFPMLKKLNWVWLLYCLTIGSEADKVLAHGCGGFLVT